MRHSPVFATLVSVPLLVLAGCMVGPDYKRPPTVASATRWTEPASEHNVDVTWWRTLGDPVLDRLVEAASTRNLDLLEADGRLREARANRAQTVSGRLPQVNATGSATTNQISGNGEIPVQNIPGFRRSFDLYDAGFDASWEIDLWGRVARQVEASDARSQAAREARRDVLLQTIAEVVRAYVDLRGAQARLASASADADARERTASLVGQRYRAGDASLFDDARAEEQARSTRSALAGLAADARSAAYRLALLTGQPPEALAGLADKPAPLPTPPSHVGVGLRSDLLRRRPDIRQAERNLAAATADVGVATADLFPRVTLIGGVGQQAQAVGDLTSSLSTRYQFGPSFSWPILSFGRIRAQIHAAGGRADQAGAAYEKAVLTALSDSETALNRYAASAAERRGRDAALAQAATALDLARQRYVGGEDSLLTLLSAQSEYSATEQSALAARAAELTALVALYKALGGGWEAFDVESADGLDPSWHTP
jgi:NodT family efflux transporter outer membrane factor (OMF) lipoprotein